MLLVFPFLPSYCCAFRGKLQVHEVVTQNTDANRWSSPNLTLDDGPSPLSMKQVATPTCASTAAGTLCDGIRCLYNQCEPLHWSVTQRERQSKERAEMAPSASTPPVIPLSSDPSGGMETDPVRQFALVVAPPLLIGSMLGAFRGFQALLGPRVGYVLGFVCYWLIWYLAFPLWIMRGTALAHLFLVLSSIGETCLARSAPVAVSRPGGSCDHLCAPIPRSDAPGTSEFRSADANQCRRRRSALARHLSHRLPRPGGAGLSLPGRGICASSTWPHSPSIRAACAVTRRPFSREPSTSVWAMGGSPGGRDPFAGRCSLTSSPISWAWVGSSTSGSCAVNFTQSVRRASRLHQK